jgi:hypothetical protein
MSIGPFSRPDSGDPANRVGRSSAAARRPACRHRTRRPRARSAAQGADAHCRRAREPDCREPLGARVEPHDGVRSKVAHPNDVAIVDVDGIRLGVRAQQPPFAPAASRRVEHPELPRVPLADPDPSSGIRPDAARSLTAGRRVENGRSARPGVDATDVAACQGRVVHGSSRGGRDAVGPLSARRSEGAHAPPLGRAGRRCRFAR